MSAMSDKLKLDLSELVFAWEDDTPDNAYYLDTRAGIVKLVNRTLLDLRDLTDEIEKNRERYLYMPKAERTQLILDLKEFWSTVQDDKLRNILSMAFESPHVLSSFKKILEGHADELKRFDDFRLHKTRMRIEEWLNSHGLKFELAC